MIGRRRRLVAGYEQPVGSASHRPTCRQVDPKYPVVRHSRQHELLNLSCCCTDEFLDAEESDEDDGDAAYSYKDLAAAFGSGGRSGSDVDQSESASDVEADSSDMDQPKGKFGDREARSGSDEGDAPVLFPLVSQASCLSAPWHLSRLVASFPVCSGKACMFIILSLILALLILLFLPQILRIWTFLHWRSRAVRRAVWTAR